VNTAIAAILTVAIAVRVVNQRIAGSTVSVDRWFWRLYVERSRAGHGFPPDLPRYLLDEQQWYPPLFPWILVRSPPAVLAIVEPWLGVALDLMRLLLVLAVATVVVPGDAVALGAAGAAFALAPVLVFYNAQPNPRALGALLLDTAFVGIAFGLRGEAPVGAWLVAVLAGGLILLTHKMTAQLLAFLLLAGSLGTGQLRLVALLAGAVAVALVLSGGFYLKVLVAHWDIVSFWNRNWRWLGADPVRESPVYGDPGFETPGKHHPPGLGGARRHVFRLLRLLPAAWPLALPLALVGGVPGHPAALPIAGLLGLQLGFALLTIFAPPLKCLGSGYLYLYNAASPAALLWGIWIAEDPSASVWLGWLGGLGASVFAIGQFWLGVRRAERKHATGWEDLIAFLRTAPRGPVLCLPMGLYDELTYRTEQPVLFGGHGLGFRRLEPVFPVLRLSVEDLRDRYGLRWVVAREDALNDCLLRDLPDATGRRFGSFRLFEIEARG